MEKDTGNEITVESVKGDSFYSSKDNTVRLGDSKQNYGSNSYAEPGSSFRGANVEATQLEKLNHELTHGRDHLKLGDKGYRKLGDAKDAKYKNGKEKSAIESTNKLREELNRPPRTSYKNPFKSRRAKTPDECKCELN